MKFTTLLPLRFIGKELQQRAMYFEVRDYDGVEILEVPEN